MIIANYTPDDISYVHGGIPGVINSGHLADMPENKARFLFSKFDKRGLLLLQFGDDPQAKKEEALRVYKEFWRRQVMIFNQANEARQSRNVEYSSPTAVLIKKAHEMGLKLNGPWNIITNDNQEMSGLKDENAELRVKLNTLSAQFSEVLEMLKTRTSQDPAELTKDMLKFDNIDLEDKSEAKAPKKKAKKSEETIVTSEDSDEFAKQVVAGPDQKVVDKVKKMSDDKFIEWVLDNSGDIMNVFDFPTKKFIKEEWSKTRKMEDWPLPE